MLWLNTSWVLYLTNIFSSYLSFFSVIFSHWYYHYPFSLHHTSSLVTFIFFSFSSSLPTWHCLCFTLSGGFSHYYMEDNHIFSLFHFIGNGLEIKVWKVVLLVRIHVISHYGESLLSWVMYFHWRLFSID